MQPPPGVWSPPCPVCGRPSGDAGPGASPRCGLPAVGQAALVVARIGATLTELARDRDDLLVRLRAAAPGVPAQAPAPGLPTQAPAPVATGAPPPRSAPGAPATSPWQPPPAPSGTPAPPPGAPATWAPAPPPPPAWPAAPPPATPRPRLSPEQVLLGLGALLVVAAALTFVAVAWTRLGVVFQSLVMLAVTGVLCAASAWTARRGLRATEEALAAAGAALLAVDLAAARWLGLGGVEDLPLRLWWAISCAVLVVVGLLLGRATRTTATWPLVALLAAQPLPLLLLPGDLAGGPAGAAAALGVAAADLLAARTLRRPLAPVALVLAAAAGVAGAVIALVSAVEGPPVESWTATGVLLVAGAAAVALTRVPRPTPLLPAPVPVAGIATATAGLALAASLELTGSAGSPGGTALGLLLLSLAVLAVRVPQLCAGLTGGGAALAVTGAAFLSDRPDLRMLVLAMLAAAVPAGLAAVRLPGLRPPATAAALAAPALAVLTARSDGLLDAPLAGLLLALLGALAFGVAAARARQPEERACAVAGALVGAGAGLSTADVGAWGQVGVQLGVVGAAALCYAVVAARRWVGVVAVADLVAATWIAVGGAEIRTPEAYTLPAAAGLLLIALPALRDGARSWAGEGAAVAVALVPSALVVVADPTALRLALVVAAALAATVAGTLLHRQAPFVVGAGVLLVVAVGRLAPYAPLLPRWITLGTAGLLLIVVGATYERRRQQAREAVAWVAQMR